MLLSSSSSPLFFLPLPLSLVQSVNHCAFVGSQRDGTAKMYKFKRFGDGGMNWETGIDIYPLLTLHIKWMANENPLYLTGNSIQCSVVT